MILYHVSSDIERPLVQKFEPRVPRYRAFNENDRIPRISFAPDVESCFKALPEDTLLDINQQQRFILYRLTCDPRDPNLLDFETVAKYVPDALYTREYWYTNPVQLRGEVMELVSPVEPWFMPLAQDDNREDIFEILSLYPKLNTDWLKSLPTAELLPNLPPHIADRVADCLDLPVITCIDCVHYKPAS